MNKVIKILRSIAMAGAVLSAAGCATEYKIVERVNKDGTIEKCVAEKNLMDKVNDVGVENAGTLRLMEVGGQYGFGIWNGIQGERQIRATRGVSSAINRNTGVMASGINLLNSTLKSKSSSCNGN